LRPIIEKEAEAWAVASCSAEEIDRINILRASILAMHRALDALGMVPGHIAVDGNRFTPWNGVEYTTVVHGDALLANIAAASVLAKTARDDEMIRLAGLYPAYGWDVNKGYPPAAHRAAIAACGPSPLHRRPRMHRLRRHLYIQKRRASFQRTPPQDLPQSRKEEIP